jgi:UDP-N-acetylmuramoyl-tripeptide--D-alanyl-D-alanine ligase
MPTFAPDKMAAWTGGRWTRRPGAAITGFTQDTRQLAPGQVFVAIRTDKRDGHEFLGEALARGATAALVSHESKNVALPQLMVADPLTAFQRIAREQRREFHGLVVGVTGSVGKTSTKDLLGLLLGGPATVMTTEANLNNHLGVPLTLTRLDPAIHLAAVVEAGISGPGEMAPLVEMIEPDHAVVTLVAPAHLEKLGNLEGVAAEKALLPAGVRSGGLQVFPSSCQAYAPFRALNNPLILVPEKESPASTTDRTVKFGVDHHPEQTVITLDTRRRFTLRRVSHGMAQNASLVLALASELGVGDAVLQSRLWDWRPSKWRGELHQSGAATVYADFYNANPASMIDAIDAFHGLAPKDEPRLYVLGCMEELGPEAAVYHRQLGRGLQLRRGDYLFAIGDQTEALREGLLENGNEPAQIAVITDLQPVRDRLAGFKGAVFLKASRRHHLEAVLDTSLTHSAP